MDPKTEGPKPAYPQKPIDRPGSDAEMTPRADHGKELTAGGPLDGSVALITGGDSGIGRAVAIAFAREGADVLVSYLPEEQPDAEETCRWVTQAGRRALALPGDIQQERHCTSMIERALEEFGRLDILVNNAAYQSTHEDIKEFTTPGSSTAPSRPTCTRCSGLCRARRCRTCSPAAAIINTTSVQALPAERRCCSRTRRPKAAIKNFTQGAGRRGWPTRGSASTPSHQGRCGRRSSRRRCRRRRCSTFGEDVATQARRAAARDGADFVLLASRRGELHHRG